MKCSLSGCGAYARVTYIYKWICPDAKYCTGIPVSHVGTYAPVSPQSQSSANIIF